MQVDIVTLFPEMFEGAFGFSIIKRAKEKGLVKVNIHNLRDWADDNYRSVDDRPYGGGPGMILRVDVLDRAIQAISSQYPKDAKFRKILTDAGGDGFGQKKAVQWSELDYLMIICGHYEGVDYRVHQNLVDEVISIGPYVLSGGEIPAMVIVDTVVRLIPGSLGNQESLAEESHSNDMGKEYCQYTRPEDYRGWKVPEVLLSGNHAVIKKWRAEKS